MVALDPGLAQVVDQSSLQTPALSLGENSQSWLIPAVCLKPLKNQLNCAETGSNYPRCESTDQSKIADDVELLEHRTLPRETATDLSRHRPADWLAALLVLEEKLVFALVNCRLLHRSAVGHCDAMKPQTTSTEAFPVLHLTAAFDLHDSPAGQSFAAHPYLQDLAESEPEQEEALAADHWHSYQGNQSVGMDLPIHCY